MRDGYERILVLVIDGLRPDAITRVHMPNLTAFAERAWQPPVASTVRPSITVAALSSLGTGVSPETHRLLDPSLDSLARLRELRPSPSSWAAEVCAPRSSRENSWPAPVSWSAVCSSSAAWSG